MAPLQVYDITKQEVRDDLNKLHFICKINGDRFHLCVEDGKPGFCQQTFKRSWFLAPKKRVLVDFIKHDNLKKLQDGKARCFSVRTYSFVEI